ncbi:MAG: CBS domain-containing protein [Nitrososphaerota archaeon]|nr:CBS domain-containing protein [Nitrososphaerota archaeon]
MVADIVYVTLAAAVFVSFWSSLVEATYLTLRPFSLSSAIGGSSSGPAKALAIANEKTKLVSVTTFTDTISSVVLATTMGLILSGYFGPVGWVYSTIGGSFVIMVLLYLLPKAIGIENALKMSVVLAPTTKVVVDTLSPFAVPLTKVARKLSEKLVGMPGYREVDLADEFEDVVTMLEKAGHIEPNSGRLLRTALASSRRTDAVDAMTPEKEIISIPKSATVFDALKAMSETQHPRMPVFDNDRNEYIGAVTFRTISKAISRDLIDSNIRDYIIQPAHVLKDDALATVIEKMQDAGTTIAFVYDRDETIGMITLSDILERLLGVKV